MCYKKTMRSPAECFGKAVEMEIRSIGCDDPKLRADYADLASFWRLIAARAARQDRRSTLGSGSSRTVDR